MASAVLASVDGEISAPAEATISILDDGLLRGDGAFEVIKLYDGAPFRLDAHLDRLGRSADAIHLGFDDTALREEIAGILAAGADPDGCLRIVVTRGGRRLLTVEKVPAWAPSARVALVTLTPHELLAGVKSISYAGNMLATRVATKRDADEAVYVTPEGIVLEAPTSAVFWADRHGTLKTPALEAGILDSITREVVIAGTEVEVGHLHADDLRAAEEAFLASTTREIQPISAVDGAEMPIVGGPAAKRAAAALREAIDAERAAARS